MSMSSGGGGSSSLSSRSTSFRFIFSQRMFAIFSMQTLTLAAARSNSASRQVASIRVWVVIILP